jgi:hypothetical protein
MQIFRPKAKFEEQMGTNGNHAREEGLISKPFRIVLDSIS